MTLITAEQARTLREDATPPPWVAGRDAHTDGWHVSPSRGVWDENDGADDRLIAAAPDLAATVEVLWERIDRLVAENARLRATVERVDALAAHDTSAACPVNCGSCAEGAE